VEKDPRTSVQRIAAAEDISVLLVERILHEQALYPYHIQQVHDLISPDQARVEFFQ
jgi:hypothetical protein